VQFILPSVSLLRSVSIVFINSTTGRKMTAQRIYIVGSSDPAFPVRLVKASIRNQALSHVAQSLFTVRVASQNDLIQSLNAGVKIENASSPEQLTIEE
jgi:hypothetical protein